MIRGVIIPGLSMASAEMPEIDGFLRLENPGISGRPDLNDGYNLKEVAKLHLESIQSQELCADFSVIGMSTGGMIASYLATTYRKFLPERTRFLFAVTSANLPNCVAVSDQLMGEWFKVKGGDTAGFRRIMAPFFSTTFRATHPDIAESYYQARATGKNQQSGSAFVRQLKALRNFDGRETFPKINPSEAWFIGGAKDEILGTSHNRDLKLLLPLAHHEEIVDLGHMINLEQPELLSNWLLV